MLDRSPYFNFLPPESLDRLARVGREVTYRHMQLVYPADKPAEAIYLVLSGGLRFTSGAQYSREYVFAIYGPGQLAGFGAVFDYMNFGMDVCAHRKTVLFALSKADVLQAFDSDLRFWKAVSAALVQRVRYMIKTIVRNSPRSSLENRAIRLLLAHRRHIGHPAAGGGVVVPLSQSDIASMLDSSRARVSVALRNLQARGLIRIRYRGVVLPDIERLKAHLESG